MGVTEVVCPKCGCSARVNTLDKGGNTETACKCCNVTIYVQTDSKGVILDIDLKSKSGCLIATTCIRNGVYEENRGKYQLDILRTYRDTYIFNLEYGQALLNDYYKVAPEIVSSIYSHTNADQIFSELYETYIVRAVGIIEEGKYIEALELYHELMNMLRSTYLNER
jgi:hypothetical protein